MGEFPSLCPLESIGESYEGRAIHLATVTNRATGPPEEKPAVLVHAQIHASEFTATTAALNLLDRLLHGYGEDWWTVDHSTSDLAKIEWVIEAPADTRVGVVARHARAGTARGELVL